MARDPVNTVNRVGQRYGRLVVRGRSAEPETSFLSDAIRKSARWLCDCDCGGEKTVRAKHLQNGSVRSCGCLRRENGAMQCMSRAIRLSEHAEGISV